MENDNSTPTPGTPGKMQRPAGGFAAPKPSRTSATPVSQEPVVPPPAGASPASPWKYGNIGGASTGTTTPEKKPSPSPGPKKPFPRWIIIAAVAVVVLASLGWAGYTFLYNPDKATKVSVVAPSGGVPDEQEQPVSGSETEDDLNTGTSGQKTLPVIENEPVSEPDPSPVPTTEPAPQPENTTTVEDKPVSPEPKPTEGEGKKTTGSIEFSYGLYNGEMMNGKPQGEGTMRYTQRNRISRYDRQERYAEAGDYIQGQWYNGELEHGKWYDRNGNLKRSLTIGRPR